MKYDLIIVARSNRSDLKQITQRCIDSARADGADMKVIVVETGVRYNYTGVDETILYNGELCYNRCLNEGLARAEGDVHILANNDLVFHPGWSVIGDLMFANDIHSASVLSNDYRQRAFERGNHYYLGYSIGQYLTGWLIFATHECILKIGRLDESVDFWYSDNVYAEQLQRAGIKHALFCNVFVEHITSATLRTVSTRNKRKYLFGSKAKYYAM